MTKLYILLTGSCEAAVKNIEIVSKNKYFGGVTYQSDQRCDECGLYALLVVCIQHNTQAGATSVRIEF